MRAHSRPISAAVLIGVLSSCAPGLRSVTIPPVGVLPEGRHLRFGRGRQVTSLHAVVVTADSLSGISTSHSSSCNSCPVTVPRVAIDSVLVVNTDQAAMETFGLTAGLVVTALLLWRAASAGN